MVDTALPKAGRGEVRVRVLASSLNYTEVLIRRHLYPQTLRLQPPFVLGYDVVGVIDQLGDGVRDFQLGDRVADMTVVGSYADYRTLRAKELARVPSGIDAAEATVFPAPSSVRPGAEQYRQAVRAVAATRTPIRHPPGSGARSGAG